MDIQLNLINRSNDTNNSQIVIFQKNVSTNFEEMAVAWRVVKNLGQGWNHPFTYPFSMAVGASDSFGNHSPQILAEYGQAYTMKMTASGDSLAYSGPAASNAEVEILNNLQAGAINANIYKDGHLLATRTNVSPGQKAVFQFKPTLWVGVASQIDQGQIMNSAILSTVNTEFSLLGIASADIVMTGGGPGPNATPFVFELENLVMA